MQKKTKVIWKIGPKASIYKEHEHQNNSNKNVTGGKNNYQRNVCYLQSYLCRFKKGHIPRHILVKFKMPKLKINFACFQTKRTSYLQKKKKINQHWTSMQLQKSVEWRINVDKLLSEKDQGVSYVKILSTCYGERKMFSAMQGFRYHPSHNLRKRFQKALCQEEGGGRMWMRRRGKKN